MSYDVTFAQDITNFQRYGTYSYEYDSVGNVIFDSSSGNFSQVYLAFPLPNFVYDNTKLVSFYDPVFTEFVPPVTSEPALDVEQLQGDLEASQQTNVELTKQLDDLIAINESTPSLADVAASKAVILELRKSLGQGRVDSDFSEDFPYTPVKKESNLMSPSTTTSG